MLYKFKSRSTGDLIMLEVNGRQVLEILGKDPDAPGHHRGRRCASGHSRA
jgi:hypothetical protein